MANEYAVRIHEVGSDIRERLLQFVSNLDGSYVFARETEATRVHFQGWVRTSVKPQAFRARLKKSFPECVGNKGYSVSQVKDHEAYSRYILKGTKETIADIVCYCGIEINEDYLASEHRAYWSIHEKPSRSNRSVVEEIEEWIASQEWTNVDEKKEQIATQICDVITSRKRGMNMFYVRSVFNTVMYRKSQRFRNSFVDELISKF